MPEDTIHLTHCSTPEPPNFMVARRILQPIPLFPGTRWSFHKTYFRLVMIVSEYFLFFFFFFFFFYFCAITVFLSWLVSYSYQINAFFLVCLSIFWDDIYIYHQSHKTHTRFMLDKGRRWWPHAAVWVLFAVGLPEHHYSLFPFQRFYMTMLSWPISSDFIAGEN